MGQRIFLLTDSVKTAKRPLAQSLPSWEIRDMKFLWLVLVILAPMTSFAIIKGDGFEMLSPEESRMLEVGLESSELPSLCPRAKEFAENARWEHAPISQKLDFVLVDKKRRMLHVMRHGQVLATYTVALGGNPQGHKKNEGDQRTPEGRYFFDLKKEKSEYHLGLRINYPNAKDLAEAKKNGIKNPGDSILIHGLPNSWVKRKVIRHPRDWTKGCMAVRDYEIEEIYANMDLGGMIEICP